jgi:hypothetical protein
MINKLAMDLALNTHGVLGRNEIQPFGEDPSTQDMPSPFTPLTHERHMDTRQGALSRIFSNYRPSVDDFRSTIGRLLHDKVSEISGSTAAAQAVGRHNQRTGK